MFVKYKELKIDVKDLQGMDDELDVYLKRLIVANDIFFQDEIEMSEDALELLDEIIDENIERVIHYNTQLKTDFDRARAVVIHNSESMDISWLGLKPRDEIYMSDDDYNDIDIVEKDQKISDTFKLDWVKTQSVNWSVGKVLENFFDIPEVIEDWTEYAVNELMENVDYSAYKDTKNSNKFAYWFLNIYEYDLTNEEIITLVANENGYEVHEDLITYKGVTYNFIWTRT